MRIFLTLIGAVLCVTAHAFAESTSSDAVSVAKLEQVRAITAERAAGGPEGEGHTSGAGWSSTQEVSVGGTAFKMFSALGLTVGALLVSLHLYRRFSGVPTPTRSRRLKVVERLPIGGKTALVLVEFDGRPMILAVGAERVTAVEPQVSELSDVERLCRDEAVLTAVGS